jgi:hypothetical protein
MLQRKICGLIAVILVLVAAPALGQQQQHEQHHPEETPPATSPSPGPATPGGMMSGAGGMPTKGMMRMMMGQDVMGDMPMMAAMAGHVEGRLAFLKTELKITDAQLPLWDAVADAIRANAKGMGEMMPGAMGAHQTATLPDRLAMREKMIAGHLEALRSRPQALPARTPSPGIRSAE